MNAPPARPLRQTTLEDAIAAACAGEGERMGLTAFNQVAPAGRYERRKVAAYATSTPLYPQFGLLVQRTTEEYRAVHEAVLQDALVFDQGCVVTRDDRLIIDSCWEMVENRLTPWGLEGNRDTGFGLTARVDGVVDVPALLAKRPWWANFGHWLVDAAALLALMAPRIRAEKLHVVIGDFRDPHLLSIVLECLDRILPDVPVLCHPNQATWRFSRLHYVTPVHRPPLFKLPDGLRALREAILPSSVPAQPRRRLYLSRPGVERRRLVNETEIGAILASYGFEAVDLKGMSLRGQAALFASADTVVGVKGAAMTNLLFASPACRVLAMSPIVWDDPFFWDIAGQMGQAYVELFGPWRSDSPRVSECDFEIDPAQVREVLAAFFPHG